MTDAASRSASTTTAMAPAPEETVWATGSSTDGIRPLDTRRVLALVAGAAVLVVVVVAVVGLLIAHRLAESESVDDAAGTTDLVAETVVQPAVQADLAAGDTSFPRLERAVRSLVLGDGLVRVKLWRSDGRILWSDEPRLIGKRFALDEEEREVLDSPRTEAEVSDADAPENVYERGRGPLLEVYRPVTGAAAAPLLFEAYFAGDVVDDRTARIWSRFAAVTLGSLVAVLLLLLVLLRGLLRLLDRARGQREALLQHAVTASEAERRRIAADLHDGVVQDLVATSFTLSAAAGQAHGRAAEALTDAARTVRGNLAGMRSLLVDIYPPSLEAAGIGPALHDLGAGLATRGLDCRVVVELGADDRLPADVERLVFRVAHELLVNAGKHADADRVGVLLHRRRSGAIELRIEDDGRGFDPADRRGAADEHFGLRLLEDAVARSGLDARLLVRSAPGAGTTWRLEVRP